MVVQTGLLTLWDRITNMPNPAASGGRTIRVFEQCTPASTTTPYGLNNAFAINQGDLLLCFIVNKAVNNFSFLFAPDNATQINYTGQYLATSLPAPSVGAALYSAFPARASAAANTNQATVFITTGGVSQMRWYSVQGGGRDISSYANVQGTVAAFPPSAYNINTRTRTLGTARTAQGYTRNNVWMQYSASGFATAPATAPGGIFATGSPWSRFGIFGSSFFPGSGALGTGSMIWLGGSNQANTSAYADTTAPNIALGVSVAGHYLFTAISIPSAA